MGAHFLRVALAIWVVSRIRFDLTLRHRRRNVETLARDYVKKGDTERVLLGEGVIATHEMVDLFGFAACGLSTRSVTGGKSSEVTCRACRRIHLRAVHVAMDLEGGRE